MLWYFLNPIFVKESCLKFSIFIFCINFHFHINLSFLYLFFFCFDLYYYLAWTSFACSLN